jgi:hypothetical protein
MCARVFIFFFVFFCLHDQLNKPHFENEIVKNKVKWEIVQPYDWRSIILTNFEILSKTLKYGTGAQQSRNDTKHPLDIPG